MTPEDALKKSSHREKKKLTKGTPSLPKEDNITFGARLPGDTATEAPPPAQKKKPKKRKNVNRKKNK